MAGLKQALAGLGIQSAAWVRTRVELFSLEAQQARSRLLGQLAVALLAAVLLFLALLVATVAFALYVWPGEHRYLALGLLALVYAIVGGGLAWWLWHGLRHGPEPFAVTLQVLAEDMDALKDCVSDDSTEASASPAPPPTPLPEEAG